ncbi:MAG: hypothetical protein Q9194_003682 [Teloschistes cf. exilis]
MKLSSFGGAFAVLSQLVLPLVAATCYFPNGTDRNIGLSAELYHPCNGGDRNSMCCRTRDDDWCRSDGLCLNFQHGEVWRESCTDPTWRSPECVKLCVFGMDELGGQMVVGDERVTVCGDGSYCCGMGGEASRCCREGRGVWIANGTAISRDPSKVVPQTLSSSSTTTTTLQHTQSTRLPPSSSSTTSQPRIQSTSISSSRPTSAPLPNPPPASDKSYKRLATLIGGILGGIIVLLLLLAILIYLLRRRHRKNHHKPRQQPEKEKKAIDEGIAPSVENLNPPPQQPQQQQQDLAPLYRPQAPAPERQRQRQRQLFNVGVPEIDGRVRPPEEEELDGRAVYEIGEGMVWVDRRRNAVMRMGF